MFDNVFDVFYKKVKDKDGRIKRYGIVTEAVHGNVDCFFTYKMKFNTRILGDIDLIKRSTKVEGEEVDSNFNDDVMTPTLVINDIEEFKYLLTYYVELALAFYDEECFPEEIRDSDYRYTDGGISKEKAIMTLLWSNATNEDFLDPCHFLRKRIAFFELGELEKYREEVNMGYSEYLKSDIGLKIVKNKLENETPYSLVINLYDHDSGEKIYEFPHVYFGIDNGVGYIYAVQNDKRRFVSEKYQKKVDRLLYKVNEGLDVSSDTYDNYGVGNLKDVTPNAVVAVNILMGLFKNYSITKVKVPSLLITRWNAKMLQLERQRNLGKKEFGELEIDYEKYLYLQSNLTEKYLRLFRRIGYHHSSIMVSSYPGEISSELVLDILGFENICNNNLLDETFNLENNHKKGYSK